MPGPIQSVNEPRPLTKRLRRGWLLELAAMAVLYFLYDWGRDVVAGSHQASLRNAKQIIGWERFLHLDFEHAFQSYLLRFHPVVSFGNIYYGTVHFVLPLVAFIALYRRAPARYVRWRNAFLVLLALGIAGFWAYPLTPPRLMPPAYGFVDTPAQFYNFGPQQPVQYGPDGEPTEKSVKQFGNLYSGLPSLHVGWSGWSVLALLPLVRRRWLRVLLLADLPLTAFAIYMTGNHRVIDAAAGWAALGVALLVAIGLERLLAARRARRASPPADPAAEPAAEPERARPTPVEA